QSNNIEKKRFVRQYKIPYNYIVETTWGCFTQQIIRCKINYLNKILQYQICYGFNFQNKIFSAKSTSNIANKYKQ
ncbi:4779_t:CDS:1, partial [Gigaspora margarita]